MSVDVEVLVLTKAEVEDLISLKDPIDAAEVAYKALGTKGELSMPQKQPIYTDPDRDNFLMAMPSYLKSIGVAGIKWGGLYLNRKLDMPIIWGTIIILNDPETSLPYAIMDGTAITNTRTAGGHAVVAAKYLAKKNSNRMAIIGCGAEARTGLPSFNTVFPLEEVNIYDIKPEAISAYQQEMSRRVSAQITPKKSAQEAVKGVDIILMATISRKPVVLEPWVPPGCFVAGIQGFRDLDPMLSKKADKWVLGSNDSDGYLMVDGHMATLKTDIKLSRRDVYADMGEIVTGVKQGRENDHERIVYTHMGMGAHDIALAQTVYRKAKERGIGTKIRLI